MDANKIANFTLINTNRNTSYKFNKQMTDNSFIRTARFLNVSRPKKWIFPKKSFCHSPVNHKKSCAIRFSHQLATNKRR